MAGVAGGAAESARAGSPWEPALFTLADDLSVARPARLAGEGRRTLA